MTTLLNQQPRYLQLAQTLINEIQAGKYGIGDLLPTEYDLCEQFGASRFTVREAVKRLVQMGLVDRQAGVGTRVRAQQAVSGYQQVMQQLGDLQQYTADTELDIVSRQTIEIDESLCGLLRATPGETWLRIEALRRSGDSPYPICVSEIYIHPAFRTIENVGSATHAPIYTLIERQFGEQITEVQQEIRAVNVTSAQARQLNVKARSAALWICRHYINRRGEVVEVAISTHPAERFSYSEKFQRDWRPV
ncbi:GntR family transcriptional regulator [Pandoraea sp.]|uniref:GntR family transcriptional regulator n=1 Tax=Pandoraea sp. TaxID=1883445 RepID=UPI00120A65A8|nr:GntR family transcriptional regulator [Pandoraea sp.]TAL53195.1 MAG: GntR family transcriptional regulator [Pandoraea sp.]TAM20597.1 MAG: GntR family transcriptional regulator [Pandoraea sp.]